jgi:signal peptidase II
MKIKSLILWGTLFCCAIIDRLTKVWALHACRDSYAISSWLQCDLVINRGVSFGMFDTSNPWVFGVITLFVIALTALVAFHAVQQARQGYSYVGELCIIVGSLSNILDRFLYDGVVDFIVVSCRYGSWPAYNGADALIFSGVVILIINTYRGK